MRVVGFIRISTDGQAQEGIRLKHSRRGLRPTVWLMTDWQPLAEADKSVSAKDVHRPELQADLQLIIARAAEVSVVYKASQIG